MAAKKKKREVTYVRRRRSALEIKKATRKYRRAGNSTDTRIAKRRLDRSYNIVSQFFRNLCRRYGHRDAWKQFRRTVKSKLEGLKLSGMIKAYQIDDQPPNGYQRETEFESKNDCGIMLRGHHNSGVMYFYTANIKHEIEYKLFKEEKLALRRAGLPDIPFVKRHKH